MKFSRKFGCLLWAVTLVILLPLLTHLLFIRLPPYLHEPIKVHFKFVDSSGEPVSGVKTKTHEWGRRQLLPIPFTHSWITTFTPKKTISDSNGELIVSYRQSSLELDSIVIDDSTISEFTATFHRHDGKDFPSENYIIEKYGVYPDASDPHLRRYTILIPNH
jgi:hypothetical protein